MVTPDSGATDILMKHSDAHCLENYLPYYSNGEPLPQFNVANNHIITPLGTGALPIPRTTLSLTVYVFRDEGLVDNLFSLAPLLNALEGSTGTFFSTECSITGPASHGHHPIIFYGTKHTTDNIWQCSLPKPASRRACTVVRHETHAEIVLYASAVFGNPTFKTFANAVRKGWLSNYPDLTLTMLKANKSHTPAVKD
jgi:hypothetical protein